MRAKPVFAASLLAMLAEVAAADPYLVETGEHGSFTRVVTPLPNPSSWTVVQRDKQVIVTLQNHDEGFNTNTVFDLIGRDRIAEVSSDDSSLTLTLACDCTTATFTVDGPYLVIDVAEQSTALVGDVISPEPAQTVMAGPLPVAPPEVPQAVADPQAETSPEMDQSAAALIAGTRKRSARIPVIPILPSSQGTIIPALNFPQPVLERSELRQEEQEILNQMQEQLAEQLGSAATNGVLNPVPGRALNPEPNAQQAERSDPDAQDSAAEPALGPLANIRITSSMDRPRNEAASPMQASGLSCPSPGAFDLPSWGTKEPFATQIGRARLGLYGELDRLDHSVATRLAQNYLYFGFGAEARQILNLDPALAKSQSALMLIADVFDGIEPTAAAALIRNADCDPEVVLWSTLVQPEPVQGAKPDVDATLRALNNLPVHLRQILAPLLSKKLLAYGEAKGAAQALRSLERQSDPLLAAAKLAQAELSLHNGDTSRGTAQLARVADENTEQSPRALIALVDAQIAADQPISYETAELIAAYAHELQSTDLGPDLRRAHVLALLKTGQFDAAFEASAALGGGADTAAAIELRGHLLRELTAAAGDIVFLEHVFAQDQADIASLPAADLTALAKRFLEIGFAQRAEETLSFVPPAQRQDEYKMLAAKTALALGKPLKAQAELADVQDNAAQRLRADAKRMLGAHDEAHDLYVQVDQSQPAAETAWLAEDWQGLTTEETPVFGAARQLAAFSDDPLSDAEGVLARSALALDESAAARQTLADLLNAEELRLAPEN